MSLFISPIGTSYLRRFCRDHRPLHLLRRRLFGTYPPVVSSRSCYSSQQKEGRRLFLLVGMLVGIQNADPYCIQQAVLYPVQCSCRGLSLGLLVGDIRRIKLHHPIDFHKSRRHCGSGKNRPGRNSGRCRRKGIHSPR